MKRLAFPVQIEERPVLAFDGDPAVVERVYGPDPLRVTDPMQVPGPQLFWAVEYTCGLQIVLTVDDSGPPRFVTVSASDRDPEHVLVHLGLPTPGLWIAPSDEPKGEGPWQLWRQDDNGSKALVKTFHSEQAARCALAVFEGGSHKQTYWLQRTTLNRASSSADA